MAEHVDQTALPNALLKEDIEKFREWIEEHFKRFERSTLLGAKRVLTMDDMPHITGMSKNYIYRLVSEGKIPVYKCGDGGKMNFFKRDEIEAWLTQNRVPSKSDIAAAAYVVNNPIRKGGRK